MREEYQGIFYKNIFITKTCLRNKMELDFEAVNDALYVHGFFTKRSIGRYLKYTVEYTHLLHALPLVVW